MCFTIAIGFSQSKLAKRFEAEGVVTTAKVTEKHTERRRTDKRTKTIYYITFSFNADQSDDPRRIANTKSVDNKLYNQLKRGDHFKIMYLPSNPQTIEINFGAAERTYQVLRWVTLVIAFVLFWGIWFPGLKAVHAIKARRFGEALSAEVTAVVATNTRINRRHLYRLRWRDQHGRIGHSFKAYENNFDDFRPGASITVFAYKNHVFWRGDVGGRPMRASSVPKTGKSS